MIKTYLTIGAIACTLVTVSYAAPPPCLNQCQKHLQDGRSMKNFDYFKNYRGLEAEGRLMQELKAIKDWKKRGMYIRLRKFVLKLMTACAWIC